MERFSDMSESSSENDYMNVYNDSFDLQFNSVFESNVLKIEEEDVVKIEKEEEEEVIRNSIFNPPEKPQNNNHKNIETSNKFIVYKEEDEDYIIFRPAKEMKNCQKYKNIPFKIMKVVKPRKEEPDDIQKKIKSRFFKTLKTYINEKLNILHINKKFEFLPKNFIENISKAQIKEMLDKTLEEIIISFKKDNSEKVKNNCELLELLKKNMNNIKIKKLYRIFSTRIEILFKEYLKSEEFDKSITKLKNEGNYSQYIEKYISLANNFVEYFSK